MKWGEYDPQWWTWCPRHLDPHFAQQGKKGSVQEICCVTRVRSIPLGMKVCAVVAGIANLVPPHRIP